MKASGNGGIAVVNVNQIAASVIRDRICCEASVRVGWQEASVKVERAVCDEGSDKNGWNAVCAAGSKCERRVCQHRVVMDDGHASCGWNYPKCSKKRTSAAEK